MTAVDREFRVRVATAGSDTVDGSVAFTLGGDDLAAVPVASGQVAHLLSGRTESRPFTVPVLDRQGILTGNLTADGRWSCIGRLVDVQSRTLPSGSWETYATGRLSAVSERGGPGRYEVEISDESWRARRSQIFEEADTTQLWPHGVTHPWRGFPAAHPASGTRLRSVGNIHRIRVVAGGTFPQAWRGRDPLPSLLRWLDSDAVELDGRQFGGGASGGNFRKARLRYGGTDYEIVSFGPGESLGDLLETLRDPERRFRSSEREEVVVHVWVYSPGTPPASAQAAIVADGAEPSEATPLHVGLGDTTHPWGGTGDGWIHPATLTRRYWESTGQSYDSTGLSALEADSTFPLLAFRVTATPSDPDQWFSQHVWGPCQLIALRDSQGRRKLVDMRLPTSAPFAGGAPPIDIDALPVLDDSNSRGHTWQLVGRDGVNSIRWSYLHCVQHGLGDLDESLAGLDGISAEERDAAPIEGDTIVQLGRRETRYSLIGVREPTAGLGRGFGLGVTAPLFEAVTSVTSRDILDRYQDGAVRGSLEVGRSVAEGIQEGDLVILDQDSLKGANPASGDRSGQRLVQVIGKTAHPAYAEIEYSDLGPRAQPLPAPTLSAAPHGSDPTLINVTLSEMASGVTATVQVAYSPTSTVPDGWATGRSGLPNGTHTFGESPGSGFAHVRAKAVAPGRLRSIWVTALVDLGARPALASPDLQVDPDGTVRVSATPNSATTQVLVEYGFGLTRDDASSEIGEESESLSPGAVQAGAELAIPAEPGQWVAVRLTPQGTGGTSGSPHELEGRLVIVDDVPFGYVVAAIDGNELEFLAQGNHLSQAGAWAVRIGAPPGSPNDPEADEIGVFEGPFVTEELQISDPEGERVWVGVWFYTEWDDQAGEPTGEIGPRVVARARPGTLTGKLEPDLRWQVERFRDGAGEPFARVRMTPIDPFARLRETDPIVGYQFPGVGDPPGPLPSIPPVDQWTPKAPESGGAFDGEYVWEVALGPKHFSVVGFAGYWLDVDGAERVTERLLALDVSDDASIFSVEVSYDGTTAWVSVLGDADTASLHAEESTDEGSTWGAVDTPTPSFGGPDGDRFATEKRGEFSVQTRSDRQRILRVFGRNAQGLAGEPVTVRINRREEPEAVDPFVRIQAVEVGVFGVGTGATFDDRQVFLAAELRNEVESIRVIYGPLEPPTGTAIEGDYSFDVGSGQQTIRWYLGGTPADPDTAVMVPLDYDTDTQIQIQAYSAPGAGGTPLGEARTVILQSSGTPQVPVVQDTTEILGSRLVLGAGLLLDQVGGQARASVNPASITGLGVPQGGTGQDLLPSGGLLVGAGLDPVESILPQTNGNVLTVVNNQWQEASPPSGGGVVQGGNGIVVAGSTVEVDNWEGLPSAVDRGRLDFVSGQLAVVLGDSGNTAAPGNHTHTEFLLASAVSTVGGNLIGLATPAGLRYPRINSNGTVSVRTAAQLRSEIGAIRNEVQEGATGRTSLESGGLLVGAGLDPVNLIVPQSNGNFLGVQNGQWAEVSPPSAPTFSGGNGIIVSGSTIEAHLWDGFPSATNRGRTEFVSGRIAVVLGTSGNTAAAGNHTHTEFALSSRQVIAEDGLSGGGPLTGNVTVSVDSSVMRRSGEQVITGVVAMDARLSMSFTTTARASGSFHRGSTAPISTGVTLNFDGLLRATQLFEGTTRVLTSVTGGDGINVTGASTIAVDSSVVRTSRTITAGAGLTGGGTLALNRTVSMGTPSQITATTENGTTDESHTHALAGDIARVFSGGSPPSGSPSRPGDIYLVF